MSRAPSPEDSADALRPRPSASSAHSAQSDRDDNQADHLADDAISELYSDDEDAEQPTDDQILEETGLLFHPSETEHGAASALNAVLQGPYFDDYTLSELTGGTDMDAYDMNTALQSFDLSLQPVRSRRSERALPNEHAFLCYHESSWYAIRRFGVHWMHLRDTLERPFHVERLELCLTQLQADGCEIYAVAGKLPRCDADERSFWKVPFSWASLTRRQTERLVNNIFSGPIADDDYHIHAEMEELDRLFAEDLCTAVDASLADVVPSPRVQP